MKHTNTPNAGELLAGFLTEAIQEQAKHLTPEQAAAFLRAQTLEQVRAGVEAAPSQPVEVIAREPSGLYWDYMNRAKDFTK